MLKRLLKTIYPGSTIIKTWPLKGGIVAEMTGVEIEEPIGRIRKVVVRQHETAVPLFNILQLTRGLGLPSPVAHYLDASVEPPALVMDYVEGAVNFGMTDVASYMDQMAGQLAAIHGAGLAGRDVSFLKVRQAACIEGGRVSLDSGAAGFDVARVVTVLGERPLSQKNRPGLLHGDYWAANLLWRDGELAAVIDWEDAALGDPLKDLAEARVEIVWLFGAAAAERFLDYYRARVEIDYSDLPFWDLCAVLRLWRLTQGDWGWLVDFVKDYGRDDITEGTIQEGFAPFVGQALGEWGRE